MIYIKSKALDQQISVDREIGWYGNTEQGPTVVVFAGIHGNEPSGIFALRHVFSVLDNKKPSFKGFITALAGNKPALELGERYIKHDLNRVWHEDNMQKIKNGEPIPEDILPDVRQQLKIYNHIEHIFREHKPPYYFIDLHTTSSDSIPFITMNDTMRNRAFARKFPVPIILGIEEFLPGTMLSYINDLGPVGIGFEAGIHDNITSIDNHISCIWLVLEASGCMEKEDVPSYDEHFKRLGNQSAEGNKVFEIRYRHERTELEKFKMLAGFENFQSITKKQYLADNTEGKIFASEAGRIFLPLYQDKGDDGYFIIREIKWYWLRISAFLRKFKSENFFKILPGVHRVANHPDKLKVNAKIARWFILDIFHLFGFRRTHIDGKFYYFTRRKFDSKEPLIYKNNN
jgi:hypothetical protein